MPDMGSPRRQWQTVASDAAAVRALIRQLELPEALAQILVGRGIREPDRARDFLDPRLSRVSDPCAMTGMNAAVERILPALERGERIAIYGDYDVDGVTGSAVLVSVLRRLGGTVDSFIPDRQRDGYGLSTTAAGRCLAETDPGLLVTVDCGTLAVEAVKTLQARGVDVIVADHHELSGEVAPALAVVNPKQDDDASIHDLAGVAVAFKLCHALIKRALERGSDLPKVDLREWLDLVAVGIVADVVPLTGENRILTYHGLRQLNAGTRPGLDALLDVAGIRRPIRSGQVAFMLGPRLNAAGRLGDAHDARRLLLSETASEAGEIAHRLDAANTERRAIEKGLLRAARKQVAALHGDDEPFGVVAAGGDWHVGVIGIVASRLCDLYGCPSVVIGFNSEGDGRGSARSVAGVNILDVLQNCREALDGYGGHAAAAGLTLHAGQLDAFRERFNACCARALGDRDRRPVIRVDAWIGLGEADHALVAALDRMAPFGAGNPEPVLGFRSVRLLGPPRLVGGDHLKMTLGSGERQLDAIAFRMGSVEVPDGPLDVLGALQENTFRGRTSLQLRVADFRAATEDSTAGR